MFGDADTARSFAVAEMMVDGEVVSRALVSAVPEKAMALPDPRLTTRWSTGPDGKPQLTIGASRIARGLWVGFGTTDAVASDNYVDLLPGESVTVSITSTAPLATLKKTLELRHLGAAK